MSETANKNPNVSKTILERLSSLDDLPHFPNALIKLERVLSSNDAVSTDEIVQLVAQDPRLAAGLIGVVNTAKYTTGTDISDLSDAIVRVGVKDVRLMAHAINYKSAFKSKPPFSEKLFLKHALVSAFIAQRFAKSVHVNAGEAFLCGLMRDIGIYLLAVEDREGYQKVIERADHDISKLLEAESGVFGTHHAMMSARLLQQWKFPLDVVMGVAFHHSPNKADSRFQDYAYVTYLAEQAAFRLGLANGVAEPVESERDTPSEAFLAALEYFGVSIESFDELIEAAYQESESAGMV